jgi:hypothetical protein
VDAIIRLEGDEEGLAGDEGYVYGMRTSWGMVATYVVEAGCVEAANGAGADENDMNGTMRGRKVSIHPARYGTLT